MGWNCDLGAKCQNFVLTAAPEKGLTPSHCPLARRLGNRRPKARSARVSDLSGSARFWNQQVAADCANCAIGEAGRKELPSIRSNPISDISPIQVSRNWPLQPPMRRSRVSPMRMRRRTPCTTTPLALRLVTMAGKEKACPNASTPQTFTGNCTLTLALRRRSMYPLLGLLGEILTNPGGFANLRALLPCGYQSLSTRARAKAKAGLQLVEILHGTGARATRIAASSAWSGGGLGSTGLGRNREH